MARSRSAAVPVVMAVAVVFWACSVAFVPSSPRAGPAQPAAAAAAALAPAAAQADVMGVPEISSSVSLAGLYEPIMLGIVFGTTLTTLLGLLVAAWLQFKKGPTLGL